MSLELRRVAAAVAIALLVAAAGKGRFVVHISSVRDGFYRIHEEGILLDMPSCLYPCHACEVTVDLNDRSATFAGAACKMERIYRSMEPVVGRYDIWIDSAGRDLYRTRIGGWLMETRGCDVAAFDMESRVVIDRRSDRILLEAPDHPDASITGRVTCPILRVYSEVLF